MSEIARLARRIIERYLKVGGGALTGGLAYALLFSLFTILLAAAAIARDPAAFRPLLAGRVGVGPGYDTIRRLGAWLRGRRFDPAHGSENGSDA